MKNDSELETLVTDPVDAAQTSTDGEVDARVYMGYMKDPGMKRIPPSQREAIEHLYRQITLNPTRTVIVTVPDGRPFREIGAYMERLTFATTTDEEKQRGEAPFTMVQKPDVFRTYAHTSDGLFQFFATLNVPGFISVLDLAESMFSLDTQDTRDTTAFELFSEYQLTGGIQPIIAVSPRGEQQFRKRAPGVYDRCAHLTLPPLTPTEQREWVEQLLHDHRDTNPYQGATYVTISEEMWELAFSPKTPTDTVDHPLLAAERLAVATKQARRRYLSNLTIEGDQAGLYDGDPIEVLCAADFAFTPVDTTPARFDADAVAARLRKEVRGQDEAITTIVDHLAVTMAGFTDRPDRPKGVFLFAGPSGVGKTQLATSLCRALFGSADQLIRLDMSEYNTRWEATRLIGPGPGYVGADEPDSWLTTKINRTPRTVLLLDEIEKADPQVWNLFLQVFDAGRLTDSQGTTASFADAVIIMTSNLGATSMNMNSIGFGSESSSATTMKQLSHQRTFDAVKKRMSPELVNRMDAVIAFNPLPLPVIREIAAHEVDRIIKRLAQRGYEISVDEAVIDHLASCGYEPAFGARHVQRAITQQLLTPLARLNPGSYAVTLTEDGPSPMVAIHRLP